MIKELQAVKFIKQIEEKHSEKINTSFYKINIGDTIRLSYIIPEGEKDRIQFYEGLVISKQNRGYNKTFTIRRMVQGIGIEQTFAFNSPKITGIKLIKAAKVRRSKLYFIRALKGKAAKLKQRL